MDSLPGGFHISTMSRAFPKVFSLAAGLAASAVFSSASPSAALFPFEKGRYWLYDGKVAYSEGEKVKEKKITGWRSEVVAVVEGKGYRAALLKGSPADLAWYEEGAGRGDVVIVVTGKGEFHEVRGGGDLPARFAALKPGAALAEDFIDQETMLFRHPAREGDRCGDPEAVGRGPRYCWVVDSVAAGRLEPVVKGVPEDQEFERISLGYATSPDLTRVDVATGLGVVFYQYTHHGTRAECELRLVETGVSGAKEEKDGKTAEKPEPKAAEGKK